MGHFHDQFKLSFCPVCGGSLRHELLKENEPARLKCPDCGFIFYQDPKVVACSVVEMPDGIVLLKRGINPQKGKWVIPGGYVERGEKVENAALRETEEECGLRCTIDRPLGVYSYTGSIPVVIVYVALPVSGELSACDETLEAAVFSLENIPWADLAFKSTEEALRDYLRTGKTGKMED